MLNNTCKMNEDTKVLIHYGSTQVSLVSPQFHCFLFFPGESIYRNNNTENEK